MKNKLSAKLDDRTPLEFRDVPQKSDFPDKDFSGNLHFRIDPHTHRRIYLAATQSNKKVTAWAEGILSSAADEVLGYDSDRFVISSPAIRDLIEDPDKSIELLKAVLPFLQQDDAFFILKFNIALKKLLVGFDAIKPFFLSNKVEIPDIFVTHVTDGSEPAVQLVAAIAPFLKQTETYSIRQFTNALKLLLLGLDAVKPFLKEDVTTSALSVASKIGDLLTRT